MFQYSNEIRSDKDFVCLHNTTPLQKDMTWLVKRTPAEPVAPQYQTSQTYSGAAQTISLAGFKIYNRFPFLYLILIFPVLSGQLILETLKKNF